MFMELCNNNDWGIKLSFELSSNEVHFLGWLFRSIVNTFSQIHFLNKLTKMVIYLKEVATIPHEVRPLPRANL